MRKGLAITAIATAIATGPAAFIPAAVAGGLWLNEYGDFASGRASAGAAAGVDDASTLLHNPASMTRLGGRQLLVTAALLQPSFEFDPEDPDAGPGGGGGGDGGVLSPAGGVFYVHDINSERWDAGVYLSGLAGLGLDYDDDWIGRYQSIENSMLIAALAPTLAYRVSDRLSVGASLQWYFASLDLSLRVPNPIPFRPEGEGTLDGTDNGLAYTLGVLYEFSDTTRIGINYQSELEPDFGGGLELERAGVRVDTNTTLTMAQTLRLGLRHQLNPRLALNLSLGWDDWSALDEVFVAVADTGASLEKDSRDTSHVALGVEYAPKDRWLLTAGISYDSNPMDARNRTADMPLGRQMRYAAGGQYRFAGGVTLAGYINYADLGAAKIVTPTWRGDYGTAKIYQVGFSALWHF